MWSPWQYIQERTTRGSLDPSAPETVPGGGSGFLGTCGPPRQSSRTSATLLPRKAHCKLTLPQVCCRSGGHCCRPCWCRSHVSLLQVVSLPLVPGSMCVCWARGEGAVALLVRQCDVPHLRPTSLSHAGAHSEPRRTIWHPGAVMTASVLPGRPPGLMRSQRSCLPHL